MAKSQGAFWKTWNSKFGSTVNALIPFL